ncbi:MAG: multiheme c-type cytochrome [Bacteroidetes bacterium]|nr:multiheme c-type cytochrome [Bacteroidota bacterium]
MPRKILLSSLFLLSIFVVMVSSWRCSNQPQKTKEPVFLNLHDTVKYVGIEACRKCHEDIYKTYIQTGMGQSFAKATKHKSAGHFMGSEILHDPYSNLSYQPFWQGDSLMLKEFRMLGKDTTHKRIEKIDYIVGSGHHTNSHIINTNGYLTQAPFTYYAQSKKLDLPPGFEHGFNSKFNRDLGLECISCHNAYPKFVEGSFNKYTEIPEGINCERCHGPGSLHINTKLAGITVNTAKDTDFTIVNPRKLPYDLQIDICQRCHIQGDAVLKPGKTFFDFKPGMHLSKVMDLYMPEYKNDEHGFLMAAHAQRLKKSKCFLGSMKDNQPKLNCITCHNPHVSVRQTGENSFNTKCKNCHQKESCKENFNLRQKKNKNNCVSCHMPKSGAVDIPHVSITDHYIRVVKKGENLTKGVGKFSRLACLNNPIPDNLSKAKAYLYFYEKFEHRAFHLDSAFKYIQDRVWQSYLYYHDEPNAVNYMIAAMIIEPYNLDYSNKLGTTYQMLPNTFKARQHFNFVLKENPKNVAAWNNMGLSYLVSFDAATHNTPDIIKGAEDNINKALSLDPDYEPANLNKVKVLLIKGKKNEALKLSQKMMQKFPKSNDAKLLYEFIKNDKY